MASAPSRGSTWPRARPVLAPDDLEVRVEPGIALDQHGRPVVVRAAQCARIGSWLASEENAAAADGRPSPLDAHLGPSGDLTLYVVAEYNSCLDALVPLPGNPCGQDDDVMAASRVRDSWTLGFRWDPPVMAQWDGVREVADLLNRIEFHDGSPIETDELVIAAHVRALVSGAPVPAMPMPVVPVLPRTGGRAALDRLLTIWVTEVRPTLAPDLIEPSGDGAILLSTITVVPAQPFATNDPRITAFADPDDEGRPYLAPTQLIQELVAMGGGATTVIAGSPPEVVNAATLIDLASLTETGVGPARRLVLWSHLPVPLLLPAQVRVVRNGGAPIAFATSAGPAPGTFRLTPAGGGALADGELVEVRLDLTELRVSDVGAGVEIELVRWMQRSGLDVFDRQGDAVRLRHTVSSTPPQPTAQRPVRQLVSASPVLIDGELPGVELWWHVDKDAGVDDERVDDLQPDVVRVLAEVENAATPVEIPLEGIITVQHNVHQLMLNLDVWRGEAKQSPYLRVLIELEGVKLGGFANPIELGEQLGVAWSDTQRDGRILALWVRMQSGLQ